MVETQHGLSPWGWNLLLHFFFYIFRIVMAFESSEIFRGMEQKKREYNRTNEWCLMVHLYTMDSILWENTFARKYYPNHVSGFSILDFVINSTTFSFIIYVSYLYMFYSVLSSQLSALYVSIAYLYWIKKFLYYEKYPHPEPVNCGMLPGNEMKKQKNVTYEAIYSSLSMFFISFSEIF